MVLHVKLFPMSSFLHTILKVLPDIKAENCLILHCDKSEEMNGYSNAQEQYFDVMQVTGNICRKVKFSWVWKECYWTTSSTRRESKIALSAWPHMLLYKDTISYSFHFESTVYGKEKLRSKKRSPINTMIGETISSLNSWKDHHCKCY